MEHCSSCGGNLRFNISLQKLQCDYCQNTVTPEEIVAEEAKQDEYFETTSFHCPNCYGEVLADENEAAVFCPYCGDTTILKGRVSKAKKPKFIIPFKKTKQDCVTSYKKLLRRAIYAPKALREEGVVDSFRGIYMPYWSYTEDLKMNRAFSGKTVTGHMEDEITYHYNCNFEVDASYDGISFDASKIFDDELSLAIAPFDARERVEFAPGYMSGFYADTYDVEASAYKEKAAKIVSNDLYDRMKKEKVYKSHKIGECNSKNTIQRSLTPSCSKEEVSYQPVWFMAYRFGNRMSYATINGQTGKAAGILPASPLKYVLFSLLCTIPLFFLVNMVSMLRPDLMILFSNLLALYVYLMYNKEMTVMQYKEEIEGVQRFDEKEQVNAVLSTAHVASRICAWVLSGLAAVAYGVSLVKFYAPGPTILLNAVTTAVVLYLTIKGVWAHKGECSLSKNRYFFLGIPITSVLVLIVALMRPIADEYYYIAAILQMISCMVAFVDLIYYHNLNATKPMPQFERTGGDDNAE